MHRLIKHALAQAVRWELLTRNPADAVSPPKIERKTLTTFDMAQTAELIEAVRGTRLMIPVMLGVLCGLDAARSLRCAGATSTFKPAS